MEENDLIQQNKFMNKVMLSTFTVLLVLLALIGLLNWDFSRYGRLGKSPEAR